MKKLLFIFSIIFALVACSNNATEHITIEDSNYEAETNINGSFETVNLEQIRDYVAKGYIIADVREVDEYSSGHIPDAINVPLSELENGNFKSLKKDEQYIVICRSGNRSFTASNILVEKGFNIVNVSEGMSTWTGELEH